jgi:hypothetical protein
MYIIFLLLFSTSTSSTLFSLRFTWRHGGTQVLIILKLLLLYISFITYLHTYIIISEYRSNELYNSSSLLLTLHSSVGQKKTL